MVPYLSKCLLAQSILRFSSDLQLDPDKMSRIGKASWKGWLNILISRDCRRRFCKAGMDLIVNGVAVDREWPKVGASGKPSHEMVSQMWAYSYPDRIEIRQQFGEYIQERWVIREVFINAVRKIQVSNRLLKALAPLESADEAGRVDREHVTSNKFESQCVCIIVEGLANQSKVNDFLVMMFSQTCRVASVPGH